MVLLTQQDISDQGAEIKHLLAKAENLPGFLTLPGKIIHP